MPRPRGSGLERRTDPGGFTAVEVLVSLLLLAALLQLCWGLATAQRRGLLALVLRGDVLEAERVVWSVLRAETAAGRPGRDWRVSAPGVLELRAFRGRGLPCASGAGPGEWVEARYTGWRMPDPRKDSVLALDVRGRWTPHDLVGRSAGGGCPARAGESVERWRLDPAPSARVVLLRLFERGSYHLEDAAFRYRRGGAGRQPLTGEVLDGQGSGLSPSGEGAEVRFRGLAAIRGPAGPSSDTGWARVLGGGG